MLQVNKGDRFGMLTIIREDGKFTQPSGQTQRAFLCRCDCGKEARIRCSHLRHGRVKSCSCLSGERHNGCKGKIYNKWRAIKDRCYRPANVGASIYFKRGITMCDEWNKSFICFRDWCINNGYVEGMAIDRIDNEKGYFPDNCRFVSPRDNCNNRRNTFIVEYNGIKIPFTQLLRDKNLLKHQNTIRTRIKRGWRVGRAIDTEVKKGAYRNTGYKYQWA